MFCLKYKLTTVQPVLMTKGTGDPNTVGTLTYIRGTVILGFFARLFMNQQSPPLTIANARDNSIFTDWFLQQNMVFTPAYIAQSDSNNHLTYSMPVPLSIHQEKNGTDIFDLLYEHDLSNRQTRAIRGFGSLQGNAGHYSLTCQEIETVLHFHQTRNYRQGRSEDGQIFNYEAIDSGQEFAGFILGEEKRLNQLREQFGSVNSGYLGRSVTAEYGKIKWEWLHTEAVPFLPVLTKVTGGALQNQAGEIENSYDSEDTDEDSHGYSAPEVAIPVSTEPQSISLSLTFLSDVILYNENGYSCTTQQVLLTALQLALGSATDIQKAFVQTSEIETFVGAWKLRTPSEKCFTAGSCFWIKTTASQKQLDNFMKQGIGERKAEGFGRLILNGQTSSEHKLTLNPPALALPKTPDPDAPVPVILQTITRHIVQDELKKAIRSQALHDMDSFDSLPSKSCLGRIEQLVKEKQSLPDELGKFKEKALRQLENCYSSDKKCSLKTYLTKFKIATLITERLSKRDLGELCKTVGITLTPDAQLEDSLYKEYLLVFLKMMRKRLKGNN